MVGSFRGRNAGGKGIPQTINVNGYLPQGVVRTPSGHDPRWFLGTWETSPDPALNSCHCKNFLVPTGKARLSGAGEGFRGCDRVVEKSCNFKG